MTLDLIERDSQPVMKSIFNLQIIDENGKNLGTNLLVSVKELQRRLGEIFDPIIKKANDAHKEACNRKKEYMKPLEQAESILKHKLSHYIEELEAELKKHGEVEVKHDSLQKREIWRWKVVDAAKVKPKFLIPDEKEIGRIVKSAGKDAETVVGGIEVYKETILAVMRPEEF